MASLRDIASKLAKLVPLLASSCEHEVLATVRAMDRRLQSEGLDFFDLAQALKGVPYPSSPNQRQAEPNTLLDIAFWCRDRPRAYASQRERAFVHDMVTELTMGRRISPRQEHWLRTIHGRTRREYDL
jgi:hypothetical protein